MPPPECPLVSSEKISPLKFSLDILKMMVDIEEDVRRRTEDEMDNLNEDMNERTALLYRLQL